MKVLQVCNHFRPCIGGIERHVEELCRNLIKLGHESDVLCLNTCAYSNEKLPPYEEYKGIRIFRLSYINLKLYNLAGVNVLKYLRDYDIIHVHGLGFFSDFLAITASLHKKPLVLTTHGGIFHTKAFYFMKLLYFHLWFRILWKRFKKIIAVSRSDEKLFSKIASNVVLIPNGVEVSDFKIKRNAENNVFLYVGRISKNKRIDNLIETVAELKKDLLDVRLYIVGEDWEGLLEDLKNLAQKKNLEKNVIFIGKVDKHEKLVEYYSIAKFFVSASEYEGFGISVLEAMAAGCTVVVNNIDAFRELIRDGENGFIVDFSNHREASRAILNISKMDLENFNRSSIETAKQYDWQNIIGEIERIYRGSI